VKKLCDYPKDASGRRFRLGERSVMIYQNHNDNEEICFTSSHEWAALIAQLLELEAERQENDTVDAPMISACG
jgi:hypothetical protein